MRCSSCGRNRASGRTSPLGSPLCTNCYDKQYGVLMGMMAGSPGLAVAGPGIVRWVREALNPKRKATRLGAEARANAKTAAKTEAEDS